MHNTVGCVLYGTDTFGGQNIINIHHTMAATLVDSVGNGRADKLKMSPICKCTYSSKFYYKTMSTNDLQWVQTKTGLFHKIFVAAVYHNARCMIQVLL